jgi:prepilin-type N-terminal cleavage/methylation domain-containing protein
MPTSSPGAASRLVKRQDGVTLIEMLIVMTLIALLAGLTYPSAASGLDAMRLRSAADRTVSFLNTAIDRADRRQQVIELRIAPAENALAARTADLSFDRTFEVPDPVHISAVEPPLLNSVNPEEQRRFLVYPGGAVPRIAIELTSKDGRKRWVVVDPITGVPHAEMEHKPIK